MVHRETEMCLIPLGKSSVNFQFRTRSDVKNKSEASKPLSNLESTKKIGQQVGVHDYFMQNIIYWLLARIRLVIS